MASGKFALLNAFRLTFAGTPYKHRDSTLGNKIGRQLFEDLLHHSVSFLYNDHVQNGFGVVNRGGQVRGKILRRNDSVFGRPPAGVETLPPLPPNLVREGHVAEPRIGCEVKIIAKAQLKQIDRVINDLSGFALRMKALNAKCINLGLIGVNHEPNYVGFEGERQFKGRLGSREPTVVSARLREHLVGRYDELLVVGFRATNQPPYPFLWLNQKGVELDYGAVLTRVGELYQDRFK